MAEAILTEVLKTIAGKVGSEVYDSIVSAADIDSQIKELQNLKSSIEAALLDADSAQVCSHSQRDVLKKLESGLDKLIDFQDAKATKARQKEVMGGSKLSKELRLFFSPSNQVVSPFKDSRKLKGITGELSLAARNYTQFGTICSSSSVNKHRTLINESGSFTSTDIIIGRDGDRDYMVNSLLESSAAAGILSVSSIVGMGGVGKTTLAQYVYNDDEIKKYFDLQLWVSTTQEFDVKDVVRKALASAREEAPLDYEMDQLQQRLFQAIAGNKFMLVLDGVWDSDDLRAKWLELKALLRFGGQGSKVLLTTRSDTVAKMMGTQEPYMVGNLRDDDSWRLFQHVATTEWHEPGVEAIGKEIAEMCPRVPLVIRAIGSLLAGKHTVHEWQAFRNDQLTNFASYGRDVMSTLKLSYDHLGVGLKLCVAYCSLFPKGFDFQKQNLVHLWIAMGYVEAKYEKQSLEHAAEEYVLCLFERGFFYSRKRNGYGCPDYFRMHNLMHDLVLSIAGFKYKMTDSSTNEFDERVCHISYNYSKTPFTTPSSLFKIKQLKSFLVPHQVSDYQTLRCKVLLAHDIFISRVRSLRVLRMHGIGINKLPRSLGELIHLRYLDFSLNPIRKLPNSITQLVNLYLLDLSWCESLEELPKDIGNLVMLKHLNLCGCNSLSRMPKGLSRLTGLESLGRFVVGKPRNSLSLRGSNAELVCGLADLSQFNNLKGGLTIDLIDRSQNMVLEAKAANMDRKELMQFCMKFRESKIEDEMVLDNLKPGVDLKYLEIEEYGGHKLPCWIREGIHCWLPNLIEVRISDCGGCIHMCSFGRLPHLKYLILERLAKVEYIENGRSTNDKTAVLADEHPGTPLFPSLEYLWLNEMPQLKGWWSVTDSTQDQGQNKLLKYVPAFPKVDRVYMGMEVLISLAKTFFQVFSSLECLYVVGKSKVKVQQMSLPSNVPVVQNQPAILLKSYLPKLLDLQFRRIETESLPEEFRGMSSLKSLYIYECEALEGIPEWIDSLTSLEGLHIDDCPGVKSLPQEIINLTNLKSLSLFGCSRELEERCKETTGEDWPKIQHIPEINIRPAK